jgi:hypothetical protein
MDKIKSGLQKLLIKAKSWADTSKILNKQCYPKKSYVEWQEQVIALLRKLPNAKKNIAKFIRLQRHRDYTWVPDLGNRETRSMLTEASISETISFLEELLEKI